MAKEHLLFDKTEIVVRVAMGNNVGMMNLQYGDITSISIAPCEQKKLLGSKPSEKISIVAKKLSEPIALFMHEEKNYWDEYKAGIEKFAKDNRISFHNELEPEQQ